MAVLLGDSVAGHGISSAVNTVTTLSSRIMGNAVNLAIAAMKKAQEMAKFVWEKTATLRKSLQKKFYWAKGFLQRMVQFSKTLQMWWKMVPIIVVFAGIILIFTNALYYIVLAVAYIAISILQIIHFLLSLPPFIYLVFFIFYFVIVDIIPFIMISCAWIALLVVIVLMCCILSLLNEVTNGGISKSILCQNTPTGWYTVPNYQHGNQYLRGVLCSQPCKRGYQPEEVNSGYCVKQSKTTPSFCPQASVMRLYAGVAQNEVPIHADYNVKGNLQYLAKKPDAREEILLKHFVERIKYLERCKNPDNPYAIQRYDAITKTICANLDVLKDTLPAKEYARLSIACSQPFCNAKSSYPFCSNLSVVKNTDLSALVKKIIYALISLTVFCIAMTVIINELAST